jgi:hypothetical protein
MARIENPQSKEIIIKRLAKACAGPGGSHLLRNVLAPGAAVATGWTVKTTCKYVEDELNRNHNEEW